jgi:hypothetical protein
VDEFADVEADDVATILASMLDGFAVQVTLGDPAISAARMCDLTVRSAESLLGCELPPVDTRAMAIDSADGGP